MTNGYGCGKNQFSALTMIRSSLYGKKKKKETIDFSKAGDRVRFHVELSRKFEVIVEFYGTFPLPVVVEPFQLNSQYWWQLL